MSGRFDGIAKQLLTAVGAAPRAMGARQIFNDHSGGKWPNGLSASGRGGVVNHALARQNARTAMHESVQARAVVERTADTVADGGLRLELSPCIDVLGISRDYATSWARDVEARFDLWAKDKKAHRANLMNFYQSQNFWQLCRHRDNDQFVRFFYESDADLQNPLQFDFLDPDQIRGNQFTTPYNYGGSGYTSSYGFQSPADGIVRDSRGRETGYKVWIRQDDGTYKDVTLPAKFPGGRTALLHGFQPEYAGQGRGYSRLAHAIQEFENITDFSAAVIKKAINQSNIVAFVEPSKDADASNPLEDMVWNREAGPAAQLYGQNPAPVDGVPVVPTVGPGLNDFYRVPEATVDTPGSLFIGNLKKGSSIKFPQNSAPGDTYDKFVDAFASHISASLKIPLEVVLMKFGQNYSASRATLLLFWRVCCLERQEMATDYLNPTVEMWLSGEIAAGRIIAPGWTDPRMKAAWLNCTWIGSGPPDIDPAKSAKAARENMEIGRTNAEREARDFNGTSAADNVAKNNAAFAGYKAMPWNPPPAAPAPAAAASGQAFSDGRVLAAWLDEVRMIVREEIDNA